MVPRRPGYCALDFTLDVSMLAIFCSVLSKCRTLTGDLHNFMQFILIIRPFATCRAFRCWNVRISSVWFNLFVVRFIIVGGSLLFFRSFVWMRFGEFSERWCNFFWKLLCELICFIGRVTFTILNLYFYYLSWLIRILWYECEVTSTFFYYIFNYLICKSIIEFIQKIAH